jgi:N-acetylglucosaminyl-diphospho-decaprenol L-rhamnosyltransferase
MQEALLVIIVNYRTSALVLECLRSLIPQVQAFAEIKVVVVDNDSGDGSADAIEQGIARLGMGEWVALLRSPRNGGFAFGNNFGLAAAVEGRTPWGASTPSVVWMLNPDTVVRPGAVDAVMQFLESNPVAGIVGTGVENEDGSTWLSAFRFPSVWSELDQALALGPFTRLMFNKTILYPPSGVPRRVDWVSGASMLVRYDVIRKLGFLDEGYFMYYEETDFCLAAARLGYECWQFPASRVVHLLGKSSGVTGSEAQKRRRPQYWFESRERYFRKNFGASYLHLVNIVWSIAYPVGSLLRWLRGRPRQDPPYLWWDLLRHAYLSPRA